MFKNGKEPLCRNYYSTVRSLQDLCRIRPELGNVGFVVPESDLLLQSLLLVHGLFPEGAVSLHLRRGTTGLGDNPR